MGEKASEPPRRHGSRRRDVGAGRRGQDSEIFFFAPALKHFETSEMSQGCSDCLRPISLTGAHCQLGCDHCRGAILSGMTPATNPAALYAAATELKRQGTAGLLISGGSDMHGVVPLAPFTATIASIRSDLGLNVIVHTAITDAALAAALAASSVDTVLIDIIGSRTALREVCHLPQADVSDYELSLANLCEAGLEVIPHVVIGLEHGRIAGEKAALEKKNPNNLAGLVLVGLRPLEGTPMAGLEPPAPEAMAEIFQAARELLPDTPVMLGCERPAGRHKEQTDRYALEAGLDGIAYPADGTVARARELGLRPRFSELCCAQLRFAATGTDGSVSPSRHRPALARVNEAEGS